MHPAGIEMRDGGDPAVDDRPAPRPRDRPDAGDRGGGADTAWLERWQAAFQATNEAELVLRSPAFMARYLISTNYTGFVGSLDSLSPADQQAFRRDLAGTSSRPSRSSATRSWSRSTPPRSLAARPRARYTSFVDTAAVDGLASSTVLPPVGTNAEDWRPDAGGARDQPALGPRGAEAGDQCG